jgi:RHS repeat-associated protein
VVENNPTGYAQVYQEEKPNGFPVVTYVYGLEQISRTDQLASVTSYYVHDGHGSVRALTDVNGNVTDTYDYDAFGNLIHSTGTSANNYLFAGEQFDPDLNLYYNRARYLNTSTGRFWTMDEFQGDPFAPESLHKYFYANADPANRKDPDGRSSVAEEVEVAGISEDLDALNAEANFTVKKILNAKVVDVYSCGQTFFAFPFIHCWVYANQPGNSGPRYDIGVPRGQRGPGLILGSVSGFLDISETTLEEVRAEANLRFNKEASLSELGFVEWNAAIVAEFEFQGIVEDAIRYNTNYSFNTVTNDAINCVTFTGFAVVAAKRIAASAP